MSASNRGPATADLAADQGPSTARPDAFHWPADSARLGVIQAIFAVVMAMGFETMVESAYRYFRLDLGFADDETQRGPLLNLLPMLAIVALGFRFFWCAVNVRRYVESAHAALKHMSHSTSAAQLRRRLERRVVLLHVPLLMGHSFLFYFGSHLVADMLSEKSMAATAITFIVYYSAYQLVNVAWLWLLTHDKSAPPAAEPHRESIWMKNNLITSGIGLVLAAAIYCGLLSHGVALGIACLAFVAGSMADLARTAYHYLETPEEEPQPWQG